MRKVLILLILCSITACQIITVPTGTGTETQTVKALTQTPVSTEYFPPMVLSISPDPDTIIQLKQEITIGFSQVMEKKSVEAAFGLTPLVAGRFEWIDGKKVSFIPDQEFPVGQKISLRISSIAANMNGDQLDEPYQASFQVADPLKVGFKFPESGTEDVDTNTKGIYLTFNQPVFSNLDGLSNFPSAFRIRPEQQGSGQWINNSTYLFSLDHGLTGGTEFQIEVNRKLQSIYGTNFEISADSNWRFKTIDPGILQYNPSVNEPIPLDQKFKIIFNQSMQTETVASNFLFRDVAGTPVPGRFYWNELNTEMTFVPEKILNRATTYILELIPGSLVSGGTVIRNQLSLTYTTIQEFHLINSVPANQQPINIINGKSTIDLLFSSGLNPDLDYKKYISVYPTVEDIEITPGEMENKLIINGSMSAGQTYQVLISESLSDKWGSKLDQAYFYEFFVSPPEPEVKVNNVFDNHFLVLSDQLPTVNFSVINISELSLVLERISFSEFASIQNNETISDSNFESSQLNINTNILPNQEKTLDIDLKKFKISLAPGIYRLNFSSNKNIQYQIFIFLNHYNIFSKFSENQLFIWLPNYNAAKIGESASINVFDESFQPLYEANLDNKGIAVINPFLYGRQGSNFWIEFGSPGDANYSLIFYGDNSSENTQTNGLGLQSTLPEFGKFFISDQTVYKPNEPLYFYAVLRSNSDAGYSIPTIKEFKFFLKNIDNDYIIKQTEVVLSEFGTLTGNILIPENLSEGLYQIGFEPQIFSNKTIYIGTDSINQNDISITFNSSQYVFGDDISFSLENSSLPPSSLSGKQIHWTVEFNPVEGIPNVMNGLPDNIISSEPKIVIEDSQYLESENKLTIELDSDEILSLLPSLNNPYQMTVRVEINDQDNLPIVAENVSFIYPERYLIEVEVDSFYLDDPSSIKANIYSKSLNQKLIGAIPVEVILQKAITGINAGETDEWGDLYKGLFRTNGNGFVEYEAFLNGPGIYKFNFSIGKLENYETFLCCRKRKDPISIRCG